ncbi:carbohydrate ABC transporter substrate-binding protein, CUT1 family [Arboricoccus pini]|uniref:Probable sugar-binding periplasmic protein n=1 Tax=Arboricoccus pini TaxID=1963835 RepID=A0A212QQB3_9PROT|nr:ABC transporter substrate-binding protein [Arboricoccus pini]SNB61622.1 carbohydrate ABC transporter substrate-binding protein, CUT1 family [Arboricoccus pini]
MIRRWSILVSTACAIALGASNGVRAAEDLEVIHWWTSGGEAKALGLVKDKLQTQGVTWKDVPVAGGSGVQAMTVLRARIAAGNPPGAGQLLGFDIVDWSDQGMLADISSVAEKGGWGQALPKPLQAFAMQDGKWIAAPIDVHSTNWLWINKKLLDRVGGKEPATFDELIALFDKFKAAGITPLAHGGQPWQDGTVFENVLLSTGGPDFYRKAIIEQDPAALGSDTMKTVFERMSKLRTYFDPNFSGRDWNLATAMVIKGDAAAQVMGDWAKGEFVNAGMKPGQDFVCIRFPGTQGSVTFNSDMFAAFEAGKAQGDAAMQLAADVMDPDLQAKFNLIKGAVPARLDVPDTNFDACGKKGMKDLKEATEKGTLMGSLAHGYGAPAGIKQAFFDVVTQELNGQLTADAAPKALVDAVAGAK